MLLVCPISMSRGSIGGLLTSWGGASRRSQLRLLWLLCSAGVISSTVFSVCLRWCCVDLASSLRRGRRVLLPFWTPSPMAKIWRRFYALETGCARGPFPPSPADVWFYDCLVMDDRVRSRLPTQRGGRGGVSLPPLLSAARARQLRWTNGRFSLPKTKRRERLFIQVNSPILRRYSSWG